MLLHLLVETQPPPNPEKHAPRCWGECDTGHIIPTSRTCRTLNHTYNSNFAYTYPIMQYDVTKGLPQGCVLSLLLFSTGMFLRSHPTRCPRSLQRGRSHRAHPSHLNDDRVGRDEKPSARVRRAVWGMPYADDAGIVSKSAEGLAKMMAVFEAEGPRVRKRRR